MLVISDAYNQLANTLILHKNILNAKYNLKKADESEFLGELMELQIQRGKRVKALRSLITRQYGKEILNKNEL